ncbi:DUF4494 domain-containing protein [Carboxylicivirga marina]|uniref:DUF4494 domain-containing protein n=1 Tax=Carboxylicivirga marina TaxID=2800988 RepID=UPI00259412AE|nr:DUF4494 domain-containing protein [uncultured Carboxylicivirga sp.]
MQNLFECKVKYEKIDEQSGKEKKVSETYLIDAVSFTEAESRIYKEMESMIRGEFIVTNIRKANYTEIFENEEGDIWYKSKISFASVDEKSGKEKKVSNQILVLASDMKDAFEKIHQGMGGMTVDFDINAISESPILDFFPYFKGEEVNEEIPAHLKPIANVEQEVETSEPEFENE